MPVRTTFHEFWSMVRAGFHLRKGRGRLFQRHGLNPTELTARELAQRPVILVHGQGHNQSAWIDLARDLADCEEVGPLFTFNYTDEDEGVLHLRAKIAEVAAMYRGRPEWVEFVLVGHSRGAIVSGLYMFTEAQVPRTRVHSLISVAGRLKSTGARFHRAYRTLSGRLQRLQERFVRHRVTTVAAGSDWLVPKEAVHVGDTNGRLTVKRASHLSVLYAPETIAHVREQLILRERLRASLRAFAESFSRQLERERKSRGR